jgi:hypothetical protein
VLRDGKPLKVAYEDRFEDAQALARQVSSDLGVRAEESAAQAGQSQ